MSFNLTGGNPRAHRIRVYFEGETTVYEGMPVCYNWDTVVNWWGGSMTNGEVTETNAAAVTVNNESRYIRVELPADANFGAFAGVVAKGSPFIGKAGPGAVDIYIPNGAIVPVRTNIDTTINCTILALTDGEDCLGHPLGASRSVAIAEETGTGDTADDLILARLDANLFIYQLSQGSYLYAGYDDTACAETQIVNNMRVKSAHTGGQFVHLFEQVDLTGAMTGAGTGATGIYSVMQTSGVTDMGGDSYLRSLFGTLTLGGTIAGASAVLCGIEAQIYNDSVTFTSCSHVCALWCDSRMATAPSAGNAEIVFLTHNGACTLDSAIHINGCGNINNLFALGTVGGFVTASDAGDSTHKIPILCDGVTRYLMVSDG